jgi:hypothetical protein
MIAQLSVRLVFPVRFLNFWWGSNRFINKKHNYVLHVPEIFIVGVATLQTPPMRICTVVSFHTPPTRTQTLLDGVGDPCGDNKVSSMLDYHLPIHER